MKHIPGHLLVSTLLLAIAQGASAELNDQWYVGLGGGLSTLEPVSQTEADIDVTEGTVGTLILGRDISDRSSLEVQLFSLGEASFDDASTVNYLGADLSLVYRLLDTRNFTRADVFGAALYSRLAIGHLERDTDLDLELDTTAHLGIGAGIELFATYNLALRAEAFYHDSDAVAGTLALVGRFGGPRRQRLSRAPQSTPRPQPKTAQDTADTAVTSPVTAPEAITPIASESTTAPVNEVAQAPSPQAQQPATEALTDNTASVPANDSLTITSTEADVNPQSATINESAADSSASSTPTPTDNDGDGIKNQHDVCPTSQAGYPVQANGCALFDGVLGGIQFAERGSELEPGSNAQLDYLVKLLNEYPNASIELLAHTDNFATMREQSILTRSRLKTIGLYLVQKGIKSNRLILRSFGGKWPIHDNKTKNGRRGNNRIEISEHTR
ncbi:MAG: OmpA family protein [Granulosicoccus sp.]